jgi:glyoxylase-like metal-dependent hydrolase (beta-lactamase superfamily II)
LLLVIAGGLLFFKRLSKKTAKAPSQDADKWFANSDSPDRPQSSRRFSMPKVVKRILKITGILAGVLILALVGMFLRLNAEMSGFTPMETGKVVDDVSVIKDGFSNFFIIRNGAQYIVIDCGSDMRTAVQELKVLRINPDDVTAVFLTHTDSDHTGALGLFGKAKLYMSKEEEQMIDGRKSKYLLLIKTNTALPRNDYILLDDRQSVQVGDMKVEGFLAPGHTCGTMAYLVNDRYLFTGDILSLKAGRIAPIPSFFDLDHVQAAQSMDIIRNIQRAEYILTAHWGYTNDYKKAISN